MAVMSFAHLKKKNRPEKKEQAPVSPSGNVQPAKAPATKVMSFAHLKRKQPVKPVRISICNIAGHFISLRLQKKTSIPMSRLDYFYATKWNYSHDGYSASSGKVKSRRDCFPLILPILCRRNRLKFQRFFYLNTIGVELLHSAFFDGLFAE